MRTANVRRAWRPRYGEQTDIFLLQGGTSAAMRRRKYACVPLPFCVAGELFRRGFNDVAISSVRWHASGSRGAYVVALPCGTASAYSWQNKSKFTSLLFLFSLRLPFSLPLRRCLGRMVLRLSSKSCSKSLCRFVIPLAPAFSLTFDRGFLRLHWNFVRQFVPFARRSAAPPLSRKDWLTPQRRLFGAAPLAL